jgi:hypothetical protein
MNGDTIDFDPSLKGQIISVTSAELSGRKGFCAGVSRNGFDFFADKQDRGFPQTSAANF